MFQQAEIRVEKQEEYRQLRELIERAVAGNPAGFLQQAKKAGLKVRNFEAALQRKVLEKSAGEPREIAGRLYEALGVPERALIREFYLERIEQIDGPVREKYRQLYIDLV